MRTRKLQKQVEKLQVSLGEARQTITELKSQLLENSNLKVTKSCFASIEFSIVSYSAILRFKIVELRFFLKEILTCLSVELYTFILHKLPDCLSICVSVCV